MSVIENKPTKIEYEFKINNKHNLWLKFKFDKEKKKINIVIVNIIHSYIKDKKLIHSVENVYLCNNQYKHIFISSINDEKTSNIYYLFNNTSINICTIKLLSMNMGVCGKISVIIETKFLMQINNTNSYLIHKIHYNANLFLSIDFNFNLYINYKFLDKKDNELSDNKLLKNLIYKHFKNGQILNRNIKYAISFYIFDISNGGYAYAMAMIKSSNKNGLLLIVNFIGCCLVKKKYKKVKFNILFKKKIDESIKYLDYCKETNNLFLLDKNYSHVSFIRIMNKNYKNILKSISNIKIDNSLRSFNTCFINNFNYPNIWNDYINITWVKEYINFFILCFKKKMKFYCPILILNKIFDKIDLVDQKYNYFLKIKIESNNESKLKIESNNESKLKRKIESNNENKSKKIKIN